MSMDLSERQKIKRLEENFQRLLQDLDAVHNQLFTTIGAVSFHISVFSQILKDKGMVTDPEIEAAAAALQEIIKKQAEAQVATRAQESKIIVPPGMETKAEIISQDELNKLGEEESEAPNPPLTEPEKPVDPQ